MNHLEREREGEREREREREGERERERERERESNVNEWLLSISIDHSVMVAGIVHLHVKPHPNQTLNIKY